MGAGSGSEHDVDIMALARSNEHFRQEVMTGPKMQVVVMTIPPGGEIGAETHPETDQVLLFVEGEGRSVLDGVEEDVSEGRLVFVRAGTHHNFLNTGDRPLRIVTAYAPPEHEPGTVHRDKAEADAAEEHHH